MSDFTMWLWLFMIVVWLFVERSIAISFLPLSKLGCWLIYFVWVSLSSTLLCLMGYRFILWLSVVVTSARVSGRKYRAEIEISVSRFYRCRWRFVKLSCFIIVINQREKNCQLIGEICCIGETSPGYGCCFEAFTRHMVWVNCVEF